MTSKPAINRERTGKYIVTPIPFKAHKVGWLTAELIEDNFENHYGVEVRHLNKLEKRLSSLDRSAESLTECMALRQRLLETANSIALHETYFNSIGDKSEEQCVIKPNSQLGKSIVNDFGSIENLITEFSELSKLQSTETDWIVLAWSEKLSKLVVIPVHDQAMLMFGLQSILALNLQLYAFMRDFGEDRNSYVSSFLQYVHWGRVSERFDTVLQSHETVTMEITQESITVNELKILSDQQNTAPMVLDVRHTDDCERYRHRIIDTEWRDSFDVSGWSSELPKDKPIVVYCMYGFWVSQDVASELRAQGYDARTLIGGINSWRAMGYDTSGI